MTTPAGGAVVALLGAWLLGGCTAAVSCPDPPPDARIVILLDHGRHSSLAIESQENRMLRYSYGDWRWYADNDTGLLSGLNALFVRSPATLGRVELDARPDAAAVSAALGLGVEAAFTIQVPAQRAQALIGQLDALFFADPGAHVLREDLNVWFAPHPQPYWLAHNSNHVMMQWLQALGCESRGSPMVSRWRVAQ